MSFQVNSLGNENDSAFVSFVCFGQKSLDPESLIGNRTRKGVNPAHQWWRKGEKQSTIIYDSHLHASLCVKPKYIGHNHAIKE